MNFTEYQTKLIERIRILKREKNAVILVHNYQRSEIYEIADYIGDSLDLCKKAASTDADLIVFCGVHFMAESAAILNPDKKVVVPFANAGCAMADMVDAKGLKELQKKHPDAATVCYVNTTAEVKAMCDVCCTSANAVDVVRALPEKKIIFVPDKNLSNYVASKLPEKELIPWEGYCPIHDNLTAESVKEVRKTYPGAKVIAHPECRGDVLDEADYITSTTGMLKVAENDDASDFFVVTECGMTERLQMSFPNKKFHGICNICHDMKKTTLESVVRALEEEKPRVFVDPKVARKAGKAFDRMFELTK